MPRRPKSYTIEQKGGREFGRWLKDNRQGIARIETDDASISLGMILKKTRRYITVGLCRHAGTTRRPQKWEVWKVDVNRITDYAPMS